MQKKLSLANNNDYAVFNTPDVSILLLHKSRKSHVFHDDGISPREYHRYGNRIMMDSFEIVGDDYNSDVIDLRDLNNVEYKAKEGKSKCDINQKIYILLIDDWGHIEHGIALDSNNEYCTNLKKIRYIIKEIFLTEHFIQLKLTKDFSIETISQFIRNMTKLEDGYKFICLSRSRIDKRSDCNKFVWFLGLQQSYNQKLVSLTISELNNISERDFDMLKQEYSQHIYSSGENANMIIYEPEQMRDNSVQSFDFYFKNIVPDQAIPVRQHIFLIVRRIYVWHMTMNEISIFSFHWSQLIF